MKEMEKENNIKLIITLVISIIILITVVVVGTYSYFVQNVNDTRNENKNPSTLNTAEIDFAFETGTLTGGNLIPGDVITKSFTVKNNGTGTIPYNLMWTAVTNNFVNQNDLVVTLEENGIEIISESDNITLPTNITTSTVLKDNLNVAAGSTNEYVLKITYKNTDENQIEDMGKNISATIDLGV